MAESRKLQIKFITEAGTNFTLSISDAAENIVTAGQTAITALVNFCLSSQPFSVVLSSFDSAKLVETTETEIPISLSQ